jgi:NAD(P)H-dependent flavin oxidoreductase YrpB (nitropropane dioxygenase family)
VSFVQAAMGNASVPALAAAVNGAGGLGTPWRAELAVVRQHVRETRALAKRPFGVDLNLERRKDEGLAACLDEEVSVISLF